MIAEAEGGKENVKRNRRQIIDKKEEKVPESAPIVTCEAVNAYEASGTLHEINS
jgi:hypothetical protein